MGSTPQETDQEEHDRTEPAREAERQAQNALNEQNAARDRRAAQELAGAERRAAMAALEDGDETDPLDDEEDLKKKKAGKGISSLRINRVSSLGGAPIAGGSGLTVG